MARNEQILAPEISRTLSLWSVLDPFLNLVYPRECRLCGDRVTRHDDGAACAKCWAGTALFDPSGKYCAKCGKTAETNIGIGGFGCGECRDHAYDFAVSLGAYAGAMKATILELKSRPLLPPRVKRLIAARTSELVPMPDLVIPVPLSKKRRFERGFNQAEVIGSATAKLLGVKLDRASLARVKHTAMHRAGMDRKSREATVVSSFQVARPKLIEGKHILLVDDVLTSGSTASACAKMLKANGAESVGLFTIARA